MAKGLLRVSGTEDRRIIASRSIWTEAFIRLIRGKPLGVLGGCIVLILLLTGVFADFVAPYGFNESDISVRLNAPSVDHPLGTDSLGRDLLSRVIFGARISMYVGLGGAILTALVATLIGTISGYVGGKTDMATQRFVDAFMAIPPLFIFLTIMSILGQGMLQVIIVLGVATGIRTSRVVRSAVISVRGNAYIDAAKAIGVPTSRMLLRHILPNVFPVIIIVVTVSLGAMIIAEASLSFLGFGVPPPTPSWGGMISGEGRRYLLQAPWIVVWPGVALALVVYGINVLGDALRDVLDPRLRGS